MYQFTLRRLIWVEIFLLSLRESSEVILGYLRSYGVIFRSMQNYSNYTTKWSLWGKLFKQLRFKVTPEEKSKNPKSRIIPVGKVFFKRNFAELCLRNLDILNLKSKKWLAPAWVFEKRKRAEFWRANGEQVSFWHPKTK